jgi:hypothetical protein
MDQLNENFFSMVTAGHSIEDLEEELHKIQGYRNQYKSEILNGLNLEKVNNKVLEHDAKIEELKQKIVQKTHEYNELFDNTQKDLISGAWVQITSMTAIRRFNDDIEYYEGIISEKTVDEREGGLLQSNKSKLYSKKQ